MGLSFTAEAWRDVVGYEGLYMVSSHGRMKSARANAIMKLFINREGYAQIQLFKDKRVKTVQVHCLVLDAFVGPRPTGYQGCHGPLGVSHNSVNNLRWDTPTNNNRDKISDGTIANGSRNGSAKLTETLVLSIREFVASGLSYRKIASIFDVDPTNISSIARRTTWKHI